MKYPLICTALLVLWSAPGCQNQELIQCRQEKQTLQTQLQESEQKLNESINMFKQMFDMIEKENAGVREEMQRKVHQAEIKTQAQENKQAQLEATIKSLQMQLEEKNQALLTAQKEIKKLQTDHFFSR